jgi:hypothetical protein
METEVIYNESMIDWDMLDKQQDSAFYTMGDTTNIAVVKHKGRKLFIDCLGEMYLTIPDVPEHLDMGDPEVYRQDWEERIVRYTSDLFELGIDTDEKLNKLNERFTAKGYEIWHNNSWFEVYSDEDDFGYDVFHELKEAVDFAIRTIKDDEYWDNLHKPENYVV